MQTTGIPRARLRRNLSLVGLITLIGSTFSVGISSYQALQVGPLGWLNVANGLVDGGLITFTLGFYTLIFVELIARDWFHRRSFAVVWTINTLFYLGIILAGRALGRYLMGENDFILVPAADSRDRPLWSQAMVLAFLGSLLLNFLYQNGRLLGQRVLLKFLAGSYHQPRIESRIVLFLDLVGSTALAERIGDRQYIRFLDRFFLDMSEAIIETDAEIYKYVGDEIILSWPTERGLKHADCLRFFFRVQESIRARQDEYRDQFNTTPRFRAGAHVGEIAVGEIGDLKKEIALIGDAINTTARITDLCKTTGDSFLISADLAAALQNKSNKSNPTNTDFDLREVGEFNLRGKEQAMKVFAPAIDAIDVGIDARIEARAPSATVARDSSTDDQETQETQESFAANASARN